MLKQFQCWFDRQTIGTQLLLLFLGWYVLWIALYAFIEIYLMNEAITPRIFIRKLFTALLFTCIYHWPKVKRLFGRSKPQQTSSQE